MFLSTVELGVVIGLGGRNIPANRAFDHVAGYVRRLSLALLARIRLTFRSRRLSLSTIPPGTCRMQSRPRVSRGAQPRCSRPSFRPLYSASLTFLALGL